MSQGKARVRVPRSAAAGSTITIKTLINHKMESGQRHGGDGEIVPRQIINRFLVTFNGETVMDVGMEPAISTNPFFEFEAMVPEAGEFHFQWFDDDGTVYEAKKSIEIA